MNKPRFAMNPKSTLAKTTPAILALIALLYGHSSMGISVFRSQDSRSRQFLDILQVLKPPALYLVPDQVRQAEDVDRNAGDGGLDPP
jgi:hypothetical protein